MDIITTQKVMDKLDIFLYKFGKIDKFGWWDLEIISADADTKFTSTEFQDECQTRDVHLTLVASEHQEMNGQMKVTWRTLRTIYQLIMVHARVLEVYIAFYFNRYGRSYFLVLPIKDMIN